MVLNARRQLLALSIGLVAVALWIFFGAAGSGQFDELAGPALRIVGDNDTGACN